jgi:hypothetical protein
MNTLVPALIPSPKGKVVFGADLHDPHQLVSKLSWNRERPPKYDFTLGKRNKSAVVISSKLDWWELVYHLLLPGTLRQWWCCGLGESSQDRNQS